MKTRMRSKQNTALRTPETWERYQNAPKRNAEVCFLCDFTGEIVRRYENWFIVVNEYPYDNIAEVHHMLVPKEHLCNEQDFTIEMEEEANDILLEINAEGFYDCFMRNFTVGQSHRSHLHYHLLKWKRC